MNKHIKQRKAFTLIELLIVIAIVGILFIVLVSKVDFATDKAKATGVQTDFRSFQLAFEQVAKENAGLATFGWDTGDTNGNRIRDSYDKGDTNQNGVQDDGEVFIGSKTYEHWTHTYTLTNPADSSDTSAIIALEEAINKNLDPKLHITINNDLTITMSNGAQDPWDTEYHGYYITNASADRLDRGAIVMYSNGADQTWGSKHTLAKGIVSVFVPNNNLYGQDDYSLSVIYTCVNGYGEVKTTTSGFSNNQNGGQSGSGGSYTPGGGDLSGGVSGNNGLINLESDGPLPYGYGNIYGDSHSFAIPKEPGARFRGYTICTHNNSSGLVHDPSCFVYEEATLTWEELKDPANGEKYGYDASGVTDTEVCDYAFSDCPTIASVHIPEGVTRIGYSGFGWTVMFDIKLPSTLTNLGVDAFSCTYGCARVYLPDSLTVLENEYDEWMGSFYQSGISYLRVPGTIKRVGLDEMSYCFEMTELILEEGIEEIGKWAFESCESLKTVTIPSTVKVIEDGAFCDCASLTEIKFAPNSQLETIGDYAFAWTPNIISITIPQGVTHIGADICDDNEKFVELVNLSNVVITDEMVDTSKVEIHSGPSKLVNDNGYLFYNIDGQNYLMGTLGLSGTITLPEYYNGSTYKLYPWALCGDRFVSDIVIPNTITEIPDYAFANPMFKNSITIPGSVTTIGANIIDTYNWLEERDDYYVKHFIFQDNSTLVDVDEDIWDGQCVETLSLSDLNAWLNLGIEFPDYDGDHYLNINNEQSSMIILPDGLKTFNTELYKYDNITSIVIPSSIECSLGNIFDYVDSIYYNGTLEQWFALNDQQRNSFSLKSDGAKLYINNELLTNVTLPNMETINSALAGCSSIVSIEIPDGVETIGRYAFACCKNLQSVSFSNTVKKIDANAFESCQSLKNIIIPGSVTSIGAEAFEYCSSLTNVELCDGIETINRYAFNECSNLTTISIPDSVTKVYYSAFYNTNLKSISIGNGLTYVESIFNNLDDNIYNEYNDMYYLGNESNPYLMLVKPKNTSVTVVDIHPDTRLIGDSAFEDCGNLTSVVIHDNIIFIGGSAFQNCTNLTSVTMGKNVGIIGGSAFQECTKLVSIVIPNSVTEIKAYAFWGCSALTTVSFESGSKLTSIGNRAFLYCSSLEHIVIPEGVTFIDEFCFTSCNLKTIVLPKSLKSFGMYFVSDNKNLTSIKYRGTSSQWNSISKGYNWNVYYENNKYYRIPYTLTYNYTGD